MKKTRISESIGYIDGDLVSEAVGYKKNKAAIRFVKWGSLAACLMAVVMAAVLILPALSGGAVLVGGIERNYKDLSLQGVESGYYVYPWEYRTGPERFLELRFNGGVYGSRGSEIRKELLSEALGVGTGSGFDDYSEKTYTETFTVYKIGGISEECMIAVAMDGRYYVYLNGMEKAPATFGELTALYDLENTLFLERFSVNEDGNEKNYFRLNDGVDIMAILSEYRDAYAVEKDDAFIMAQKDYISFTATSEALGVYKRVFCISEDGYIWTNVFEYRYVYYIGEEAAARVISHAKRNAEKAAFEPYEEILAGTIVEIGDGYILIDDSIRCKDPDDGLVFRIPTDDIRIRRCCEVGRIKVGDLVAVRFRGSVDPDTLTVSGAVDISECVMVEDGIAIPE